MNATERRQYEMLQRVRDFGTTNRQLFPETGVAHDAFAAVTTLIDELTVADMKKMSASVAARARRKKEARKALTDLLVKMNHLGKVLRARGQTAPPFELPASRSDQALLTAARQFAKDAAILEADFAAYGMPLTLIADTTAAFEAAARDRGMSQADHTAARTRIRELIATALVETRRLDLVISNELAGDKVIQAVWKQARRIDEARPARTTSAEAAAPADSPPVAA